VAPVRTSRVHWQIRERILQVLSTQYFASPPKFWAGRGNLPVEVVTFAEKKVAADFTDAVD
jgi:hypothetical protein